MEKKTTRSSVKLTLVFKGAMSSLCITYTCTYTFLKDAFEIF